MVTMIQEAVMGNGKPLVTVYCLSTDSKPTNVANGSSCIEINTGKAFLFNEGGSAWVEVS